MPRDPAKIRSNVAKLLVAFVGTQLDWQTRSPLRRVCACCCVQCRSACVPNRRNMNLVAERNQRDLVRLRSNALRFTFDLVCAFRVHLGFCLRGATEEELPVILPYCQTVEDSHES
eukprot:1190852-Prorocentrum_minimum.AAC.3